MFIPNNAVAMAGQGDNTPRITSSGIMGQVYTQQELYTAASWIDRVAMRIPSNQEVEEYAWLGSAPKLREWIGPRIAKGLRENGMTIRNKKFEATMRIEADWIRRDKTQQIQMKINEFAAAPMDHDAENLSTFISNGTGSTNGLCYDGQYFFDDDHSEGSSGTQKNLLTSSEVGALNVTTAAAPTPYEVTKAVLGVIAYMMNYTDDSGNKRVNANAAEFLIMTSPALMPSFAPAFGASLINTGSGGVDNPLLAAQKVMDNGMKLSLAINPLLTYTTQFTVWRTDTLVKPLIIQEEVDVEYTVLGEDSDYYFAEDACQFGLKRICNWGYGLWQYAAHATLS
jgi:phage major head subunit gpT-like protein